VQAEDKKPSSGLNNIQFVEGDIESAEITSQAYDAILCSSAIFYFDMGTTAKKLHAWLKPGGLLAYNTLQVCPRCSLSCPLSCPLSSHISIKDLLHSQLDPVSNQPQTPGVILAHLR